MLACFSECCFTNQALRSCNLDAANEQISRCGNVTHYWRFPIQHSSYIGLLRDSYSKAFTIRSQRYIYDQCFLFSSFTYWKDMNKDKEFKLLVLRVKGLSTHSNSTSALPRCFPLRTATRLMQSRKAAVRLSTTTRLPLSLVIQSVGAWLGKASMELQKASSSVLFQQAHAWMADEISNDYKSHKNTQVVYSTDLILTIWFLFMKGNDEMPENEQNLHLQREWKNRSRWSSS